MKFAAIDIGSNAIRLLIENVYETKQGPLFHKDSLVRVPVRLGEEAFLDGRFSEEKVDIVVRTMIAMKHLIDIHKVTAYKVIATSAMREAKNSDVIIERVRQETGMEIQVISGDKESTAIMQFPLEQIGLNPSEYYLYIDVGGGSTELAFFTKGKLIANRSFPIGTLRLLNDQVHEEEWRQMMLWIKDHKPAMHKIASIGVGGNINSAYKEFGKPEKNFLTNSALKKIMQYIDHFTMTERVRNLGMKPDRADVIVPALKIYINVLKWAGIEKIYIPKQGLSDGIVSEVYNEWKTATVTEGAV